MLLAPCFGLLNGPVGLSMILPRCLAHLLDTSKKSIARSGRPSQSRTTLLSTDEGVPDDLTVATPASQVPFSDYTGTTVFHGHILDHEDLGMMGQINVV